jgi:hypothetical protein
MSDPNPFPVYQPPAQLAFTKERVVDYLLMLLAKGYPVHSDGEDYVLPQDDGEVRLRPHDGIWRVSRTHLGVLSTYGDAGSEDDLDQLLVLAVGTTPERPRRGRLDATTPATNYRTIAGLIGSSELKAVFDTYLDNQSLEQLIRILSFGKGTFGGHMRLLGTTATTQVGPGKPARFSKAGVDAWAAQLQIQAEARVLPSGSEHRRFLLLDGGRSIILGPSLNSLHKNEAVSIENDKEDRPFFDRQWQVAAPIV